MGRVGERQRGGPSCTVGGRPCLVGAGEKKKKKHRNLGNRNMPQEAMEDASENLCRLGTSGRVWGGHPELSRERRDHPHSLSPGFSGQSGQQASLASLAITEYTKATDTGRRLKPTTALHKTTGLTTERQRNLEAQWPPAYSVITCPVSWAEYFCRT